MRQSFTKQRTVSIQPVQEEIYAEERDRAQQELQDLAKLYLVGSITLAAFMRQMREYVKSYSLRLALLGKGGDPLSQAELTELAGLIGLEYEFLAGFERDLRRAAAQEVLMSERMVLWRAGLYSFAWDRVQHYAIPEWLRPLLPAEPAVDCLGGAACGCTLEWELVGDAVHVWWLINPMKEHCINCISFNLEWSPLVIPLDDVLT